MCQSVNCAKSVRQVPGFHDSHTGFGIAAKEIQIEDGFGIR